LRRRRFCGSIASTALLGSSVGVPAIVRAASAAPWLSSAAVQAKLSALESSALGRLGVQILDTATGQEYGYRSDERFLMLSSFKLLASALVLHRVDARLDSLERSIPYTRGDLVTWSPVTERQVERGRMTLAELCAATITTSDNTAANLILSSYGGPAALTAYARQLGDTVTRLDRTEPELNVPHPHEALDTTTPRAMLHTMQKVVLGDALSPESRKLLQRWLVANTTGDRRLRAGLPTDWRVGEKTGTNQTDANDIGVAWPPDRPPLLVTAYLAESKADGGVRETTLAAVGKLVYEITR
jgi:beta-lactamase class A